MRDLLVAYLRLARSLFDLVVSCSAVPIQPSHSVLGLWIVLDVAIWEMSLCMASRHLGGAA
jgi:hypothetical protein